jgi:hypothetical protein
MPRFFYLTLITFNEIFGAKPYALQKRKNSFSVFRSISALSLFENPVFST